MTYNRERGLFLTSKVNSLFEPIARLNSISEGDKNKQGSISAALSNWVGLTGFEPTFQAEFTNDNIPSMGKEIN